MKKSSDFVLTVIFVTGVTMMFVWYMESLKVDMPFDEQGRVICAPAVYQ